MSTTLSLAPTRKTRLPRWLTWLDADRVAYVPPGTNPYPQMEWSRLLPFAFLHIGSLGVLWTGWSPVAVGVAVALYWLRMFAITGFLHRYFSHCTFKTHRWVQLLFAVVAVSSVQRGPLWWAANHRHHHLHSDQPTDLHSPLQRGFWWSHIGWLTSSAHMGTDYTRIPDYTRYPELVWLNRFDWFVPLLLLLGMAGLGEGLRRLGVETSGAQMMVWGFFISTTVLFHGTSTINSLAHVWGSRRYRTTDTSRNNFWLALITMGEGWHNNHHRFPGVTRQGFYPWEVDFTYYILKGMAALGLVWDLHPVPAVALDKSHPVRERPTQK